MDEVHRLPTSMPQTKKANIESFDDIVLKISRVWRDGVRSKKSNNIQIETVPLLFLAV
ncbi:hypothetical protein [Paraburkholderia sp.]|uniref:hypothetical protein n=1 Tax=Paraburkholderia sp. TaxID=1926495 RepID=UPI00238396D9|nr:hypothetical protein [Paraburkholderia sp.]MDE1179987.1 hypothetical protein [Paraburkholderia sp.]